MLLAGEDADADGASAGAAEAGGVAVGFPLDVEVPGALVEWTSWRVRRIMSSMAAASAATALAGDLLFRPEPEGASGAGTRLSL